MTSDQPFPVADSPVAALIRAHAWSATPLGPVADWPASLRVTVDNMLMAPTPKFVVWSDALTLVYNDAYIQILGAKHPAALGQPMHTVWPEVWHDVAGLVKRALSGESLYCENMPFRLDRDQGAVS